MAKTDFEDAAANVRKNLPDYLPKMIAYKSSIQRSVLFAATPEEKEDIINSKPNTSLVEKLAELAHEAWSVTPDIESLYCAAMAVGTIIKEYGWGLQYLTPEGLCKISCKQEQNAEPGSSVMPSAAEIIQMSVMIKNTAHDAE